MGLDVRKMVAEDINSKNAECIQCGACVDEGPKKVLRFSVCWKGNEERIKKFCDAIK